MHQQRECSVDECAVMQLGRHDLNYSYTQMSSELIVTFQQKDRGISVDSLMKMSAQCAAVAKPRK